jgi:hypothetical protein
MNVAAARGRRHLVVEIRGKIIDEEDRRGPGRCGRSIYQRGHCRSGIDIDCGYLDRRHDRLAGHVLGFASSASHGTLIS